MLKKLINNRKIPVNKLITCCSLNLNHKAVTEFLAQLSTMKSFLK